MPFALMLATLTDRRDVGEDWLSGRFCVFDLLELGKARRDDSRARFAQACRAGWEGLIAKRRKRCNVPGRSRDWLKLNASGSRNS